jgi:hypothetical protein
VRKPRFRGVDLQFHPVAGASAIETRLQGLRQLAEAFTGSAETTRQDLIAVTDLGLRLLTLHGPIDSGSPAIRRVRSCAAAHAWCVTPARP